MGATLSSAVGGESFRVGGSVPTVEGTALESYLTVMADVLINPSFPKAGFDRARNRLEGQLNSLVDSRSALANRAFKMWLFEGHPYGKTSAGTLKSVATIKRRDLAQFHQSYVLPDNAVLGIAGDFDEKSLRKTLTRLFSAKSWGEHCRKKSCRRICKRSKAGRCIVFGISGGSKRSNPMLKIPKTTRHKGIRIRLLNIEDPTLNQAQIRAGATNNVTYLDPKFHAYNMGAQVLGGDFTARMNKRLRIKEGLTYSAYFRTSYDEIQSGASAVSTYTQPEQVPRAINIILEELRKFQDKPVPEEELNAIKARIKNGFVFRFETVSNTLDEYLELWQEQLPVSHLANYAKNVAAITAKDITEVMSHFPVNDISILVVGNTAMIPSLKALAKTHKASFEVVKKDAAGL